MKKVTHNNLLMCIFLLIFCLITIPKMLNHIPWHDEYWDWIITKDMNIHNCIKLMGTYGHFIIWYLMVMPFSKLELFYPYSLLWLNWISYFLAILFMWKKAPFNNFAKIIITFSWISLNYFSIVARCYSIGILLMFILASLYKEQTKKPVLYSILLVLTAHTSVLATFAVIPLAIIFIYNLLKNKNDILVNRIVYSILILFMGGILWLLPFKDVFQNIPSNMAIFPPDLKIIFEFFEGSHYLFLYLYIVSFLLIIFYSENKIKFLYLSTIIEYFFFFSFIYPAMPHLNLFLLIYIIFTYWLTPKLHNISLINIVFLIVFALLLFYRLDNKLEYIYQYKYPTEKIAIAKYINSQHQGGYIFATWQNTEIIPYINDFHYISINQFCTDQDHDCVVKKIKEFLSGENLYKRVYYISSDKINDSSIIFTSPNAEYNKVLYVTAFDKVK